MSVTFDDIRAASDRIRPLAKRTPVLRSRGLDAATGLTAFLKCENFQTGGAFKIRGATNFLCSIPKADLPRGVVAFSSGNHAQGVAIAARDLGIKATLVMPIDSPKAKLEATRAQGPEIVLYDRVKEDRTAIGARISRETGATLVPPFDHPWIVAGQGTTALELLEEVPDLDAIVVPIGGGGLMSGCSIVAKHLRPGIRVIGVEPATANDAALSLAAGRRVEIDQPTSIADGLIVRSLSDLTFSIIQKNVEQVVLVTDDEIRAAVKWLLQRMKILVEPSGAAPVAAALSGKLPPGLGRVGFVLSGGNVDFDVLASM
jgi:threonine dehydratase